MNKVDRYLKGAFSDMPHPGPVDISQNVLNCLPKREFGIFSDPFARNFILSVGAVLILSGVSVAVVGRFEKPAVAPKASYHELVPERNEPEKEAGQASQPVRPRGILWWRELRQDE